MPAPPPVELTPTAPWRPAYLRDLTKFPRANISEFLTVALINNGPRDLTLNGKIFGGEVDPLNSSTYLNKMIIGTVQASYLTSDFSLPVLPTYHRAVSARRNGRCARRARTPFTCT